MATNKKVLIDEVLDDIKENEYDSRELLFDLAYQGLEKYSIKELKKFLGKEEQK